MAEEKKRSPCSKIARAGNVKLSRYEDDPLELWVRYISQVIFDITGSGDTDIDTLINDLGESLTETEIKTLKSIENCMVKARQKKFKRDKGKDLTKERALKKIGKSLGERYDWKLPFDVQSREGWERTKSLRSPTDDQKTYHKVDKKFYKRAKREVLIPFLMENSEVFKAYVEQAMLKNAKEKEEGKQVISYGLKPGSEFPGIADIISEYANEPEDEDTKIANLMRFGKKSRRKNSVRSGRKVRKSRSKSRRKNSFGSGRKTRKSRSKSRRKNSGRKVRKSR